MRLHEWPVYVNDYGVINCDYGDCLDPYFLEGTLPARRNSWGDVTAVLKEHIKTQHSRVTIESE